MLLNCGFGEDSWESLGLPVHSKGDQSWVFIGRPEAEAEAPIFWPPDAKNWLLGKDPDAGKDWRQEEKGTTEDEMVGWHHQRWTWVSASSKNWWWTGKPGVLQFMVSQSQTWLSDWTELNLPFRVTDLRVCDALRKECIEMWTPRGEWRHSSDQGAFYCRLLSLVLYQTSYLGSGQEYVSITNKVRRWSAVSQITISVIIERSITVLIHHHQRPCSSLDPPFNWVFSLFCHHHFSKILANIMRFTELKVQGKRIAVFKVHNRTF